MKKYHWVLVLLGMVAEILVMGNPATAWEGGTLVVRVDGFGSNRGQAGANLFRRAEDLFDKPYRSALTKIDNGRAEIRFSDLPYGEYAIVVFHDENKNGQVDHNMFRFPSEPLGYPSGYKFGLTSGFPTFDKLRIRFDEDVKIFRVRID